MDHTSVSKSRTTMAVGLRGKLAFDYTKMNSVDPAEASKWVRKVVDDAMKQHPQLLFRIEGKGQYERLIIGLKSEVGKYGDW